MPKYVASIHIDIGALRETTEREIQHAIAMTTFGLQAASEYRPPALSSPGSWLQVHTLRPPNLEAPGFPELCRAWALRAGIRETTEAVAAAASQVNRYAILASLAGKRRRTEEELEAQLAGDKKFESPGLAGRLRLLDERYKIALEPWMVESCETLNKARNCLVHRAGIVGNDDLNDGRFLTVRWRAIEFVVEGGTQPGPPAAEALQPGFPVKLVNRSRSFPKGLRLDLENQEFAEIAMTLQFAGSLLWDRFQAYLKKPGVVPQRPSQATPSNAASEPDEG